MDLPVRNTTGLKSSAPRKALGPGGLPSSGKAAQSPTAEASTEAAESPIIEDSVSLQDPNALADEVKAETPKKNNRGRKTRKHLLALASGLVGIHSAVGSAIQGAQTALDVKSGKSDEAKALNSARISTLTSIASGSGVGLAIMGPIGLVVGGVVGYISGTIGNHLETKSGKGEKRIENISKAVGQVLEEPRTLGNTIKAIATGVKEGAKGGFKDGALTSKIQMAGMLDGVKEAGQYWKESKAEDPISMEVGKSDNKVTKWLKTAGGLVLGVAGVMINAPGGAVVGVLESLRDTKSYLPSKMTQNLVLLTTNAGKLLPATIATAAFGPVVGTVVGLATGSVASSADGKFGVNRKILRPVEKAVEKAHGEEEHSENLRTYYRAGKGGVVGFTAGVREGWKAGFEGGVDLVGNFLASTPESISVDEETQKREPG